MFHYNQVDASACADLFNQIAKQPFYVIQILRRVLPQAQPSGCGGVGFKRQPREVMCGIVRYDLHDRVELTPKRFHLIIQRIKSDLAARNRVEIANSS